ncbi:MAG TPA: murein biosynthesis integral membrane protein MurJ [Hyphomicrobiaceae bacterium]|nr:murein biosynthesis integral membrane protein MurJ [Hyphomicrobiaceae bacterium]
MALYRAFATVGGLTMVSRVLGFMRDILIAAVLGSGAVADAFFVAFRFPNLFRRLFGEGAFNAAFVPLFAKRLEGEGEAAAKSFAEEALAALAFVLVGFSALAMLAMPWLMLLLAPGFVADPQKYDLAVLLTQIAFPYLLCMSIVALLSGVLNSLNRFWAAAAAPIVLNLVLIAAIAGAGWFGLYQQPQAGVMLAWGVSVAGFAQLTLMGVAVRRAGFTLRLRWPRMTEGVRRLVALGIPGLVAGGITQINIVIGTIIASLQAGAVSYLYYADRLYQLPLGIVGVAIGVVLLPDLARKLKAGDEAAALDSQNRSLELGLLLTVPAAVALAVAADPMIRVLFERGAFGASDTTATAAALAAFAVGLPSFVLIKVFQPAYFAREDTATPMRFAAVNMAANALGSGMLFLLFREMGLMGHVGIALATSLAGWLNAALLWRELCRRGHFEMDARLRKAVPLILVSSLVMGAALSLAGAYLEPWFGSSNPLAVRAGALGVLVACGAIVYFLFAHLTGAARLNSLREALRRQ